METHIKIGKTILRKYSAFAHKNTLDDANEYFPVVKIIIDSLADSYDGSKQDKDFIKKKLINFAKQLYVDSWLDYAREDEDKPDIEKETTDAIERFNELYLIKSE